MDRTVSDIDLDKFTNLFVASQNEIVSTVLDAKDLVSLAGKTLVMKKVQKIITELENDSLPLLKEIIKKAGGDGPVLQEINEELAKKGLLGNFNLPDPKAIEGVAILNDKAILSEAQAKLKSNLTNAYNTIENTLNLTSNEVKLETIATIGRGVTKGTTTEEIAAQITKIFNKKGVTGLSYVNEGGKTINMGLEAVAKSLAHSSARTGAWYSAIDRSLKTTGLVKVSTHTKPSPMCSPYQGDILALTEDISSQTGYPLLDSILFKGNYTRGGGIGHTYCRHSLSVYIPTKIEFEESKTPDL